MLIVHVNRNGHNCCHNLCKVVARRKQRIADFDCHNQNDIVYTIQGLSYPFLHEDNDLRLYLDTFTTVKDLDSINVGTDHVWISLECILRRPPLA